MSEHATVQTQTTAKPVITPTANRLLQRQCACGQHTLAGGECAECKQKREGTLQRAAINPSPVHEVPPIVREVLRSPGQPLDAATRAFMEPRFGHDFSGVRVHTDVKSVESARAVNALAYTVGRDVVFGTGQYAPGTAAGQRLMAHELSHAAQQLGQTGMQGKLEIGPEDDPLEREAHHIAETVARATYPSGKQVVGTGHGRLQKAEDGAHRGTPLPKVSAIPEPDAGQKAIPEAKKICGPDVTAWLIRQIETNAKSSKVAEMRKDNEEDIKGIDLGAVYAWYNLVKTGGPWDYKKDLGTAIGHLEPCRQNCRGKLYSITLDGQCMTYEVAANVHFGYVGRAAGFSEKRLLSGASEAQVTELRGESEDDPRDVQAIKKGFGLFNAGSPSGLNKTGLENNYYDRLPAGDGDPKGCEPCSTKL